MGPRAPDGALLTSEFTSLEVCATEWLRHHLGPIGGGGGGIPPGQGSRRTSSDRRALSEPGVLHLDAPVFASALHIANSHAHFFDEMATKMFVTLLTSLRLYIWKARMRKKVTLSLDADLYREMKLQAVREDRDVSTITEELYREYLKRLKSKTKK